MREDYAYHAYSATLPALIAKDKARQRAGVVMIQMKRCPLVPQRFRRAKCYRKCAQWDRYHKVCRLEVRQRIEEAIEGRHGEDE